MSQVHKEKWVSPYNGGAELAGCGGGEGNFAKKAALELGRLQVVATVSCTARSAYQSSLLWYVANGMCAAQKYMKDGFMRRISLICVCSVWEEDVYHPNAGAKSLGVIAGDLQHYRQPEVASGETT